MYKQIARDIEKRKVNVAAKPNTAPTALPRIARVYCGDDEPPSDEMREPLLVPRKRAGFYLNCGESTIREMERLGKLTPVRLTNSPTGKVFFRMSQLKAIARGE